MLITFFTALLPVLLLVLLGFFLAKRTTWLASESLGQLASNIALPALIFVSIVEMQSALLDMLNLMLITTVCLAIGAGLVALFCRLKSLSPRFYVSTLVNPNTGNLGIPIAFALLGPEALAPAVIISTTVMLSHFTLGIMAMSGVYHWRKLVTSPPLLALLAGAVCVSLSLNLPKALLTGIDMLAGLAIPIMLLLLGRSLSTIKLENKQQQVTLSLLSIFRPMSGFLIAWLVLQGFSVDLISAQVLLIQMSMPVAVMSYLLTVKYNGPSDQIAVLTLTTIPTSLFVLWFIYQYRAVLV